MQEPQHSTKASASKGKKQQQQPTKSGKTEREKSRSPPTNRLLEEQYTDYSKIKIGTEKLEAVKEMQPKKQMQATETKK